ncbi:MAG TPA: outer membrane beta-barrel protein [Candidatus Deferrimicrobiaceae bacterium]|jgi:opacity protein-like surface antigen
MNKSRLIVILSVACLSVLVGPVSAEIPNYAAIRGGFYSPQSHDLDGFKTGFDGEAAIGHYFNRNLIGEVGVGYFKTDFNGSDPFASGNVKISAIPVTVTVKAVLPLDSVELYGGAGMGAYFNELKYNAAIAGVGSASGSASDTSFGFHLVAGGTADLSQTVFMGLEFRYLWDKASFNLPGGTADAKLDGFTTTVGIGCRF